MRSILVPERTNSVLNYQVLKKTNQTHAFKCLFKILSIRWFPDCSFTGLYKLVYPKYWFNFPLFSKHQLSWCLFTIAFSHSVFIFSAWSVSTRTLHLFLPFCLLIVLDSFDSLNHFLVFIFFPFCAIYFFPVVVFIAT